MEVPKWLEDIAKGNKNLEKIDFPLRNILTDSLYYPCSGGILGPRPLLAGNIFSFVYADYHIKKESYLKRFKGSKEIIFSDFRLVSHKEILWSDLVPNSWGPLVLPERGQYVLSFSVPFFCYWSIWQRNSVSKNSSEFFSVLFIAEEICIVYEALYCRLSVAPKILYIFRPGCRGGEWERMWANQSFFKKVVKLNSSGMPEYLYNRYLDNINEFDEKPCWDEYRGGKLRAGLWRLSEYSQENTIKRCPMCGAKMILRNGFRGKFYGCSEFPLCKGTRDYIIDHEGGRCTSQ